VFEALADARTYPEWWRPVYLKVDADCEPRVGCVSRQEFKGRLPYHLNTRSEIVRLERPHEFEVEVVGDLTGKGIWTLTPAAGGRVLRPLFRWNHNWSIKRAIEGLEPYAQRART
jgi:uncharacterized protein YndB with AHSA1/START domain